MGQWVIVSDFGDGYRIYQACELVIVLLLPSWWAGGSGLWVFSRPFLFLFCISSLSNSYFCHQFFYFLYFFYFTFVFLPPISYSYSAPPPPSLAPSGLMPHLSLLPPERHLMLVLHHRPLWQYGSSPNPIFCSSHEATVKHQLGNRKHDRRGSNFDNWEGAAVVVGRGCSTSCLLHCPPLFAPPHCLPLPTRQPITRQSFKKGHWFYLPPMSAFIVSFAINLLHFCNRKRKLLAMLKY